MPMYGKLLAAATLVASMLTAVSAAQSTAAAPKPINATFTAAAGFDTTAPLTQIAAAQKASATATVAKERDAWDDRDAPGASKTTTTQAATQGVQKSAGTGTVPLTTANFEGLSSQDNFNVLGGRVNPPDPVGDVGPNHYVEMVNLTFAVYSKNGPLLLGPLSLGSLWAGFAVDECTDNSGDPIVIYDQLADRWILTQFTTRGIDFPNEPANPFYNCVAISTTGDPTGTYFRYAFTTGFNFPDYPKYGVWQDAYIITTREFGVVDESVYGIGVYGLEREKMIAGDPTARAVAFLLDDVRVPISQIGDGLLPPDIDGTKVPKKDLPAPILGSQDDGGPYGATSDALNVWEFDVDWGPTPFASIGLKAQLPVAAFDSIFPCAPTSRDCLPQPGITDPAQFLDILSYRQRPTWRLAYRLIDGVETMVTNQSVEALPGQAGLRWYEIRRNDRGVYKLRQQGTFAPADGVHRWMGSAAMDRKGNMAIGYSVVSATDVMPGIRYTGRRAGDRLGELTLGEGTIVNGTGVQTTTNSRWGDYTSLNLDPLDDCTFWYVNEYYTAAGQASSPAGWQTRIASFKLPGC
jgi:hypothetical protein